MAELYAIVGSEPRARLMLGAGVPYLQLRFKDEPLAPLLPEIRRWRHASPGTRIIVNDDLDTALEAEAWGVHLGQEDLMRYPAARLHGLREHSGLSLGISTHDDAEIRRALDLGAEMLGFGPIFATGTKTVSHGPQGTARLAEAVNAVAVPIVAIGGIDAENARTVAETGVACVAMISGLDRYERAEEIQALMQSLKQIGSPDDGPEKPA